MKSSEVRIGGDRSNCSVCFQCGTNDSDCTKETKHGDEACRCIIFFKSKYCGWKMHPITTAHGNDYLGEKKVQPILPI